MARITQTRTRSRTKKNGRSKGTAIRKSAKCNLQFSTREREFYEQEAGFTDEEIEIFRMRSRGFSVVKISQEMSVRHDKYYSLSTIEGRIRSIKDKILRIL